MIPTGLPTLSAGAHNPGEGKACVMEMVALLAGEEWTDSPTCTHPVLARAAREVNDRLSDSERHLLVPLIGRLFGTAETGTAHERKVLSVRLAVWCARRVLPQVRDVDRPVCETAISAAEGWCEGRVTTEECIAAAAAAYAAAAAAADATYTATAAAAAHDVVATYAAAAEQVASLTDLLDEYDRLTGRTEHRQLTDAKLADLAATVAAT